MSLKTYNRDQNKPERLVICAVSADRHMAQALVDLAGRLDHRVLLADREDVPVIQPDNIAIMSRPTLPELDKPIEKTITPYWRRFEKRGSRRRGGKRL